MKHWRCNSEAELRAQISCWSSAEGGKNKQGWPGIPLHTPGTFRDVATKLLWGFLFGFFGWLFWFFFLLFYPQVLCREFLPCRDVTQPGFPPTPAAGSRPGLLWAQTSTELLILLFPVKPLKKKKSLYWAQRLRHSTNCVPQRVLISWETNKNQATQGWFLQERVSATSISITVLCFLGPYNEKVLELCKTTEHPRMQSDHSF